MLLIVHVGALQKDGTRMSKSKTGLCKEKLARIPQILKTWLHPSKLLLLPPSMNPESTGSTPECVRNLAYKSSTCPLLLLGIKPLQTKVPHPHIGIGTKYL